MALLRAAAVAAQDVPSDRYLSWTQPTSSVCAAGRRNRDTTLLTARAASLQLALLRMASPFSSSQRSAPWAPQWPKTFSSQLVLGAHSAASLVDSRCAPYFSRQTNAGAGAVVVGVEVGDVVPVAVRVVVGVDTSQLRKCPSATALAMPVRVAATASQPSWLATYRTSWNPHWTAGAPTPGPRNSSTAAVRAAATPAHPRAPERATRPGMVLASQATPADSAGQPSSTRLSAAAWAPQLRDAGTTKTPPLH